MDAKRYLKNSKIITNEKEQFDMVQQMLKASDEKIATEKSLRETNGLNWPWFKLAAYAAVLLVIVGVSIRIFFESGEFSGGLDAAVSSADFEAVQESPGSSISERIILDETGSPERELSPEVNGDESEISVDQIPLNDGYVPEDRIIENEELPITEEIPASPAGLLERSQAPPEERDRERMEEQSAPALIAESTVDDGPNSAREAESEPSLGISILSDSEASVSEIESQENENIELRSDIIADLDSTITRDLHGIISTSSEDSFFETGSSEDSSGDSVAKQPSNNRYPWYDEINSLIQLKADPPASVALEETAEATSQVLEQEGGLFYDTLLIEGLYFSDLPGTTRLDLENQLPQFETVSIYNESRIDDSGTTRSIAISRRQENFHQLLSPESANIIFRILILQYFWDSYTTNNYDLEQIEMIGEQLFPENAEAVSEVIRNTH